MHVISIVSHHAGASAPAAIGLARALAAAGHQVSLRDGVAGTLAATLGVSDATPQPLTTRLSWAPVDPPADASVLVIDDGALTQAQPAGGGHVVFVLPATTDALKTLPGAAQTSSKALRSGQWLGVMLVDSGDEVLTSVLSRELAADVLGATEDACAGAVAARLQLVAPPPSSLADLAGMKLGVEGATSAEAPATSQYTFVMDSASARAAGGSAPLTVPSEQPVARLAAPSAAPAPVTASSATVPGRYSRAAVVVPWVIAAVLGLLHLVRG
jgi:hypothetical protein